MFHLVVEVCGSNYTSDEMTWQSCVKDMEVLVRKGFFCYIKPAYDDDDDR